MSSRTDGGSKDNIHMEHTSKLGQVCEKGQIHFKDSLEGLKVQESTVFSTARGGGAFLCTFVNKMALRMSTAVKGCGVAQWLSKSGNPFSSSVWKAKAVTTQLKISLSILLSAPPTGKLH